MIIVYCWSTAIFKVKILFCNYIYKVNYNSLNKHFSFTSPFYYISKYILFMLKFNQNNL